MSSLPPRSSAVLVAESDPAVAQLRARMDAFYAATQSYSAFQATSHYGAEWDHVKAEITARVSGGKICRVLEFGAGRTGFAASLGVLRPAVHFTAQDITPANAAYLRTQADEVCVGPITDLSGSFDVIFSTFVLEHVSDPRHTLDALFERLTPGGVLLLFCPRYDAPFYLSHSADHYGFWQRVRLGLGLLARRLRTCLSGRPAFLIHLDPSLFTLPWSMDRDAIHWVSLFDLRAHFAGRANLRELTIPSGSAKDWIVKRLLTVNLAIEKPMTPGRG